MTNEAKHMEQGLEFEVPLTDASAGGALDWAGRCIERSARELDSMSKYDPTYHQCKNYHTRSVEYYKIICAALQSPRVPYDIVKRAFKAGWEMSSEGCNPEYFCESFEGELEDYLSRGFDVFIRAYAELQSPRVPVIEILDTVLEQAEDDGLWFNAKHASEAYLQQELRRLHAVIERAYAELQKGN